MQAPGLWLAGLHAHIGSQIFRYELIAQAVPRSLLDCAAPLRDRHGLAVAEIQPGRRARHTLHRPRPGRAGCRGLRGRDPARTRDRWLPPPRGLALPELVIEPGRSIVARAGVALYAVGAPKALPAFAPAYP